MNFVRLLHLVETAEGAGEACVYMNFVRLLHLKKAL